jgi:hypothetical protein
VKGFVLFWTKLGLYFHWKPSSLRRRGQEKVSTSLSFKFQINISTVPVIAIFTMFDDLLNQIFDMDDIDQDDAVDRQNAEKIVEEKFRKPLYGYRFGPRADVCFEGKC